MTGEVTLPNNLGEQKEKKKHGRKELFYVDLI